MVRLSELHRGAMKRVMVAGQPVLLTLVAGASGDSVSAFTSLCPHALGDLSYGTLHGGQIECPDHGYRFDARTGACTYPGGGPALAAYPVQADADGVVWVKADRPRWMAA